MDHSSYYDLSRPDDGRENTSYFVLDSLLKSRIECGFESSEHPYDESVNVYLVHLLSSLVAAPGLGPQTANHDVDVFAQVRTSQDPRFKCEVYRTNADHLLLSTGIFGETPYVERDGQRQFDGCAQERIGRGKAYYDYAATFHGRTGSRSSVVPRVLSRLSSDFERYVEVLFHMRGEYFNLYERLREDQFMALQEDVSVAADGTSALRTLRDEFLDAYWLWHQTPGAGTRNALVDAVKRLSAADPSFEFRLPEH